MEQKKIAIDFPIEIKESDKTIYDMMDKDSVQSSQGSFSS